MPTTNVAASYIWTNNHAFTGAQVVISSAIVANGSSGTAGLDGAT
jgi:hypothetical protein